MRLLLAIVVIILIYPVGQDLIIVQSTTSTINYQLTIRWLLADILFVIASFSDHLDGYLARKNQQVSNFGK